MFPQCLCLPSATHGNETRFISCFGLGGFLLACVMLACGGQGSTEGTPSVPPATTAPSISTQPVDQTASTGQTAAFSVVASGTAPLQYQWKKGTTNVGTNAATLTLTNVQTTDAGSYTVTVSNDVGSITSHPVTLTVTNSSTLIPADRLPTSNALPWNPGIPGGIPNRTTIFRTIDAATYGNGTTDATQTIQSALDACPVNQVVYLPPGTYSTTDSLIIRRGIVLRGAGPAQTKIVIHEPVDSWRSVIEIGIGGGDYDYATAEDVTSGFFKGSTSITVADATGFSVGDVVLIDQIDDVSIPTGNCTWYKRSDKNPDGSYSGLNPRSLGQNVEIVSKTGNTLGLGSPLYMDFSASQNPQIIKPANYDGKINAKLGTIKYAGVEDLAVADGQGANIHMVFAAYCWIKNVESIHCAGRSVMIQASYRCVVRDSYIHDALNYTTGGGSYGLSINTQTSDTLIENNVVMHFNQVVILENSGGGNVIGYNYMDNAYSDEDPTWQQPSFNTHCSVPHMELVEGNYAAMFAPDNVHGGAQYITFFRNYASGKPRDFNVNNRAGFYFETNNHFFNVVGNVILDPSTPTPIVYDGYCNDLPMVFDLGGRNTPPNTDPYPACPDGYHPYDPDGQVKATLFRHGNYDQANQAVIWDPGIENHVLPESLYLSGIPSWWGNRPWPFVQPEGTTRVNSLPAKDRYDGIASAKEF